MREVNIVMEIRCYQLIENEHLKTVTEPSLTKIAEAENEQYWVDVYDYRPEELPQLLDPLNLPQLILDNILAPGEKSHIVPLPTSLYVEFPMASIEENVPTMDYVAYLFLPNFLLTLHQIPLSHINDVVSTYQTDSVLPTGKTDVFAAVLIALQLNKIIETAQSTRKQVDRLSRKLDKDPDDVEIDDILEPKGIVRVLDVLADEHLVNIRYLHASRLPVFNLGDKQSQFTAILDNANYLTRVVDRLETRVKDLYDHYSTNLQERTNKRLAILTVISAVFLPLTLIAGVYGMNFEHMIMIEWEYGYPIVMTSMVAIAVGLVVLFWKKGWFD